MTQKSAPASLLSLLILFALAAPSPVLADSDTSGSGNTPETPSTRGGRHGGGSRKGGTQKSARAGKIMGHCTLLEGPDNPVAGPCSNTTVILTDAQGNDISDTRTTSSGDFEFDPGKDSHAPYTLRVGSRFYEVVSPTGPVPGGVQVELKLRQR